MTMSSRPSGLRALLLVFAVLSLALPVTAAEPTRQPGDGAPLSQDHPQQAELAGSTDCQNACSAACPADARPAVVGRSHQLAVIDPATGTLISGAEATARGLELSPELVEGLSTSSEGLIQKRSPIEGGGWSVDLKGRFRHVMMATIESDGTISYSHDVASAVAGPDPPATETETADARTEVASDDVERAAGGAQ